MTSTVYFLYMAYENKSALAYQTLNPALVITMPTLHTLDCSQALLTRATSRWLVMYLLTQAHFYHATLC